jgi:endonuclease YncB( thermonuclease family)
VDELMLNETQIESGFATYHRQAPYAVDWYVDCRLQRAESLAQEARRGVWRAGSPK